MTSALLLVASAWLLAPDDPLPQQDSTPSAPLSARLLPRLTLRLTRRAAEAWWADSLHDALGTPLGTSIELRLEWGGADDPR